MEKPALQHEIKIKVARSDSISEKKAAKHLIFKKIFLRCTPQAIGLIKMGQNFLKRSFYKYYLSFIKVR